jgi:hypothetical protein
MVEYLLRFIDKGISGPNSTLAMSVVTKEIGIDTFLGLGRNLVVKVKLQLLLYLFVKVVFYDGVRCS